jgi:hypothetical protein
MVVLAGSAIAAYVYGRYASYESALDTTREWAQLDDFPASATDIRVEAKGSMFTREFVVTFTAPLDDINAWLDSSPGTAGVTPAADGAIRKYDIQPGGGAAHAELEVDDAQETVRIRTYWS